MQEFSARGCCLQHRSAARAGKTLKLEEIHAMPYTVYLVQNKKVDLFFFLKMLLFSIGAHSIGARCTEQRHQQKAERSHCN